MNDIMEQLCGKIGDADYQKKSVIVQGITGKFGSRHTKLMLEYGTNIVAGALQSLIAQDICASPRVL